MEAIDNRNIIGYKFDINSVNRKNQTIPKDLKREEVIPDEEEDNSEVSQVMGFSTFGRSKKSSKNETKSAKKFDIETLMAERPVVDKWKSIAQTSQSNDDKSKNDSNDSQPIVSPNDKTSETSDKNNEKSEKDSEVNKDSESDDDLIGPPLPPGFSLGAENTEEGSDEDLSDEEMTSRFEVLPISHEIELTHGSKSVTALALDPNGSRVISGGIDYELKFWDFQGMDSSLQSFRAITPCECHPIKNVEFSANGDVILVISGASVAKIVDRDGFVKGETIKGDQYISDMSHTKGHVAMLNAGVWNPREKSEMATSSNDGTCRLWDINNLKTHKSVIKPRSSGGLRAPPNTVRYTRNAELICVGCNDGSVQMWDTRKSFVNTTNLIRSAHTRGSEITCIQFSYDGNCLLSRGNDDCLKLWDMKMLRTPIFSINELFTRYSMTDCFFSPDDRLIATGVSCLKGEDLGRLLFYSRDTSELKHEIKVNKGDVIRSSWHPKLNQILVSGSNGVVKVYYDPDRSDRGAKLCAVKQRRKYRESFEQISAQIIARMYNSPLILLNTNYFTQWLSFSARFTSFQD